jgi:hypothetical protein
LVSADLRHRCLVIDNGPFPVRRVAAVGDELFADERLYDYLLAIDRELAEQARGAGCPRCEGQLLRIPGQCEHSFRRNVNTHSGST